MITAIMRSIKSGLLIAVEGSAALASAIGVPVALIFGKLFLAAILAAISLGVFLRLANRRTASTTVEAPTPWWIFVCSALASVIEVAVLVEATNLPVRFDQAGFTKSNWVLVLFALLVAYSLQRRALLNIVRRSSPDRAITLSSRRTGK